MSKSAKKAADQAEREKVHKRYSNRREPDVIYPARKQVDFYDADVHQRVAVYVRVSTDNLGQETSYELQKNYYEEFVLKHPNWSLVKIYADKGISGTSTKHRVALNQMLADSRAGKIDLIITKSVSRLARNTVDCITMVRNLAELRNPVGVFFESECIFSLNEDTSMPLSFLASIAENESRIRSRSMEVSLAQRLNGGLPLTPKLLGYSHDTDGKLVINPDEAPTVKLIFYMYLSGYSSAYIAKTLEELGKTTFLGNTKWTSNTVIQILRNERHCGDVLTRKTWTPDVISHKSKKNRGERQQSLYRGEHEAIRADRILEVVSTLHGCLQVERQCRFFWSKEAAQHIQPLGSVQLSGGGIEPREFGGHFARHAGEECACFVYILFVNGNRDEPLLFHAGRAAGDFAFQHSVELVHKTVEAVPALREQNGIFKRLPVDLLVADRELGGRAAVQSVQQLTVTEEHRRFILFGRDGIVDVRKAQRSGIFRTELKNPIREDPLDGNDVLHTARDLIGCSVLLDGVVEGFNQASAPPAWNWNPAAILHIDSADDTKECAGRGFPSG